MKVLFSMTLMLIAVFAMEDGFKKAMKENADYIKTINDIKEPDKTHTNIVYYPYYPSNPFGPNSLDIGTIKNDEKFMNPMKEFLNTEEMNISIKTTKFQDINVVIYTVLGKHKDKFEEHESYGNLEFVKELVKSFGGTIMFQYGFAEIIEKSKIVEKPDQLKPDKGIDIFSYLKNYELKNARGADEFKKIVAYGKQNPKLLFQLSMIGLLWAYANYANYAI